MRYQVHDENSFREAIRGIAVKFESERRNTVWLTRETYSLLTNLLDDDLLDLTKISVRKLDERGAKPSYANPFRPGIRALSDSMSKKLTRDFQSKMAMRMHFAYSHFVPKEFIIGFLNEYGRSIAGINPSNFNVMPDLREWVAKKLFDGDGYGEHRLQSQPDAANDINKRRQIIEETLSNQNIGSEDNELDDIFDD